MIADPRILPILGAIIICTLPHFLNVAGWVVAVCILLWGYTAATVHYRRPFPGRVIRVTLAAILSSATFLTHDGLTLEAFVALLSLMITLKIMENQSQRDRMITVITCYFLIVGSLFFDDSIIATGYMFLAILCTTAAMIHINQPTHGLLFPIRISAKLMIQAMPIMLVLFLLFPRIQGGLWGRTTVKTAKTGFSDEMNFGGISSLANSNEVAFRVEFEGEAPDRESLYWRGIVLWEFDGSTWRREKKRRGTPAPIKDGKQRVKYTLTLEPHNEHWLMALDLPNRVTRSRAWMLSDHTSFSWRPITKRIAYSGESFLKGTLSDQSGFPDDALQLPNKDNPRTRKLAASWKKQAENPEKIVALALAYFRQQPFSYTLNPGVLQITNGRNDLMDQFLFKSRKGFCEHYASSFAYLMRAAGVPARIVIGYQGGNINRYGGYLVVRQSDAHAWCEVWLPEKGWTRVDPTGSVAPERIRTDVTNVLPAGDMTGVWSKLRSTAIGKWLEPALSVWDLANSRWNSMVMGYSVFSQRDFFSWLGMNMAGAGNLAKRFGLFLAVILPLLMLAGFLVTRRGKKEQDLTAVCWNEFCGKLGVVGLPRLPGQGPRNYMDVVLRKRPDLGGSVREIISLYIELRYSGMENQEKGKGLAAKIKEFRPKNNENK